MPLRKRKRPTPRPEERNHPPAPAAALAAEPDRPRRVRALSFYTWAEFCRMLPATRATIERWYATGKLRVHIFQPQGPGGRKYVAVEEAERVLREWSFGKPVVAPIATAVAASGHTNGKTLAAATKRVG